MCSRHCIGTFWDKIIITFYEVVANYSVPETWSKHRHLKTYILHLVFLCQQLSPAAKNWSGKPIQCLQRWKAKMYWIDWTSTFSEMNFLCEVSQNCVDRYVSTELCWWSPGETDAGMQRCDVIIGGTVSGPRAEGEAWVIQSIKTHSALQSGLYLRTQQSSTSQHWAVFIFQSSSSPGSSPAPLSRRRGDGRLRLATRGPQTGHLLWILQNIGKGWRLGKQRDQSTDLDIVGCSGIMTSSHVVGSSGRVWLSVHSQPS